MAEVVKSHIENKPTRCRDATQLMWDMEKYSEGGRERENKNIPKRENRHCVT